ncbi:tripartite tricarboxylate transporter TctB family protein [Limnohabitans sp. DM1]|uniref:tripartite tricarboxylate transporter TctB family protein n=1 Tax=Limnohabitans sp. DM1 TaxID=1597955 RepID=UPI000AA1E691|nr:tripartite tricarboxylate transporter TctB family protein [Limnohabitans sp. DM1]
MSAAPRTSPQGATWDRALLILLAVLTASMVLATRQLIVPFPQNAAWFESSALFPSLMLALAAVGAVVEAFRRRLPQPTTGSDELDASQARIGLAVAILVLFGLYMWAVPQLGYMSSTLLFLLSSSRVLGFGWRTTFALSLPMALAMWWVFAKLLKVHFGHGIWL